MKRSIRFRSLGGSLASFAVFLFARLQAGGEPPSVDYLFPSGARQGATSNITMGGKLEPWPVQVWSDHPGLAFKAEEAKGKLNVQVATNTPIGPHLIRIYNADGAAIPRCFTVGAIEEIAEKEPNDKEAQRIEKLPVTVNGRLEKIGDADLFAVEVTAGQWLIASVEAYGLDAPLDPLLHLFGPDGTKIAFNHDGGNLDPLLVHHAKQTGTYAVQVTGFAYPPKADVRLAGSDASVYRLTLTTGPVAEYAFPATIQRGRTSPIQLFGWNLGATGRTIVHEINTANLNKGADRLFVGWPTIENRLAIEIDDLAEQIETEPNNSRDLAQPISVPGSINGRIDPVRDEDRFQFVARKGQRFSFAVQSTAFGIPLDAVLAIEDATGKQLALNDDARGSVDAELNWTSPEEGRFVLVIHDLLKRGASNFVYRCVADEPRPDFRATIETHAVRLEPGKTAELKINVSRLHDYSGNLHAVVEQLPDGVTATSPAIPSKGGEVKIVLSAGDNAKPANQPVRVVVVSTDPEAPRVRIAPVKIKGQNTAAGGLLINETDQVWLTVVPKPVAKQEKEAAPKK